MFAAPPPDDPSMPGLFSFGTVVGLLIGYGLGYVHAVWRRARSDYVKTKESVPVLRSAKWVAWRSMVQRGAIVVLVLVAAIAWLIRS